MAGCGNANAPAECTLSQDPASSPKLTSVAVSSPDVITIDGDNFPAGQDIICEFIGAFGTGVLTSANRVECSFEAGVPASDMGDIPYITFTDSVSGVALTADPNGQILTNALVITSGSVGLECSFAGGCSYEITGNGIAGLLQSDEDNSITICMNRCELDLTRSTGSTAVCTLPPLATAYSALEFDIVKPSELEVMWTGTGSNMDALNDGVNI